jgi:hypothetical protein
LTDCRSFVCSKLHTSWKFLLNGFQSKPRRSGAKALVVIVIAGGGRAEEAAEKVVSESRGFSC